MNQDKNDLTAHDTGNITLELNLDTVLGRDVNYDPDGEPYRDEPVTLGSRIAHAAAAMLVQQVERDVKYNLQRDVRARVEEMADAIVAERVTAVLDRSFTPTNFMGETIGPETTLSDVVAKRAEDWLSAPAKDSGYGSNRRTNMDKAIDEAVGREFKIKVSQAVKKAQEEALEVVAQQAQEVLVAAIKKSAGAL